MTGDEIDITYVLENYQNTVRTFRYDGKVSTLPVSSFYNLLNGLTTHPLGYKPEVSRRGFGHKK